MISESRTLQVAFFDAEAGPTGESLVAGSPYREDCLCSVASGWCEMGPMV